jgi:2'-5' RNA ligase
VSRPRPDGLHKLRLFFALWPRDSLRAALAGMAGRAAAGIEGEPVPPANLHVTLAFLGMVAGSQIGSLIEIGGSDAWPLVPLTFDRVEYWTRPRILVAMPTDRPAPGQSIVDGLWTGLERSGHVREARPWQPHLTLMRRIRRPPSRDLPSLGRVEADGRDWRLALVESTSHPEGPRYKPLAEWPLGAGGDSPL